MDTNGHDKDPPNLNTIIKLMGMTQSSHDAEALTALRMATTQLKKWGWTWESMLRGKIKIMPDPFAAIPHPTIATPPYRSQPAAPPPPPRQYDDKKEIEGYFNKIELKPGRLSDAIQSRLNSVERAWNNNGFLIYKDYDFLRTTANARRKY